MFKSNLVLRKKRKLINIFRSLKTKNLSETYKKETLKYAKEVNEFRNEGMQTKWQQQPKTQAPVDTREEYAEEIYKKILEFNSNNQVEKLRELFPPQTEIFYSFTENKNTVCNIHKIIAISDEIFLVAIDMPLLSDQGELRGFQRNCYVYKDQTFELLEDVTGLGVCPQKKVFAYVKDCGISLREGWDGDEISHIPLSKGPIYYHDGSLASGNFDLSKAFGEEYIPFSDGKRVLVGEEDFGVLLLGLDKNIIFYPDKKYFDEYKKSVIEDDPDEPEPKDAFDLGDFPMLHFSLSHNNEYIALGFQCSEHHIYRSDGALLGTIDPASSYPHYALFSKGDEQVAFNSCHFYNGGTVAAQVQGVLDRGGSEINPVELDMESRVYTAVATSYGYIIGDAEGYIRARSYSGEYLWDDYLGFNIQTMDISSDERFLYVGTFKGIIYKVHLNTGAVDPYKIGNSTNKEVQRWLFWEEDRVLEW